MSAWAFRYTPRGFIGAFFGPAAISGVVREQTTPVSRPVYLIEPGSLRVISETRSASDGTYSFPNILAGAEWMVMSLDPNGAYNAEIADRIQT
jgi:hypothetical protein